MGGKVLVPTSQFISHPSSPRVSPLTCATCRRSSVARTDAQSAKLITSDIDERDLPLIASKDRTAEGFYRLKSNGDDFAIARGLAYAP